MIDLKKLERDAFQATQQDGLFELMFGALMLILTLSTTLREYGMNDGIRVAVYLPMLFLLFPSFLYAKNKITNPRIGQVKFNEQRRRRLRHLKTTAMFIAAFSLVLAVLAMNKQLPYFGGMHWITALVLFLFFAIVAYFKEYPRMYFIGFLFAGAELGYSWMTHQDIAFGKGMIAYGIPGLIIGVWGVVLFRRFLQNNPLPPENQEYV